MSGLPSMMQRAGLLSHDDMARFETIRKRGELLAVDALLQLGVVDERQLVDFVASKLMIPTVDAEILECVGASTLERVPPELAWAHTVMPVSLDDVGNLTLAMADPTDLQAVAAVSEHSGAYLVRAVAPIGALRAALARHYGKNPLASAPQSVPAFGTESGPITTAAVPALAAVLPKLIAAPDKDAVMSELLAYLAQDFERVILFVHLRHQLRGRDARGPDLLVEAVTQVRIPTTGPSVFAEVVGSGVPHVGPWPNARTIDRAFDEAMGGIAGDVLVLPVQLSDKVPLVVFAAGSRRSIDRGLIATLAETVSEALQRIIQQRKQTQETPMPE